MITSQSSKHALPFFLICILFINLQLINQPSPFEDLEVATLPTQQKSNREIAWCPSATSCGFVHRHCKPCRRRWLIILSMGRSASTTLTHQMWKLPGIHMGGEENNLVEKLRDAFNSTLTKLETYQNDTGAWIHEPVSKEIISCSTQNALEAINPPPSNLDKDDLILGFKANMLFDTEDVTGTARFLQEAFPCARFLINHRSAESVKESMVRIDFWMNNRTLEDIEGQIQNLRHIGKLLPESQTHFLDSGKWTKNVTLLNEVVDWLGYSKECHFEEVLQFNTGGKRGYAHGKKTLTKMDPNCRYIGSSLSSTWW